MNLLPLLCLLSVWFGPTSTQEIRPGVVTVSEDADALLPCSLGSEQKVEKFDWRKDNGENPKQEVFFYESRYHYLNGKLGQDEQFKQRVSFFEDELETGNASIKINHTRLEDNGTYFCIIFEPHRLEIQIRLNVGAALRPNVKPIPKENKRSLLECEVQGVPRPKPEVEWKNSAGEVLDSTKSKDGRFLNVNVTESDNYTCVVTQMSIFHQINNTLEVKFQEYSTAFVATVAALVPSAVAAIIIIWLLVRNFQLKRSAKGQQSSKEVQPFSPTIST